MRTTNVLASQEWLAYDVLLVVVGAVVVTMLLVFVRKERRDRAESTSRDLRDELLHALEAGDEAALRRATVGVVDARAHDQVDLLAVLSATRDASWWTDATTMTLRAVLLERDFVRVLERQLSSPSAAERGAALLLGSHSACRLPTNHIAACMADRDSTVRLAAAAALERTQTDEAAHSLVDALGAGTLPDPRIIERLGHRWTVPVCIARLRALDDSHANTVRASLARALGLAGDPIAIPHLLWLLSDGNPNEAIQAMRALGDCAPQADKATRHEIAEAARARASSNDCALVLMATRALAATGRKRDIDRFADLVGHSDWHVRREAAVALTRMGRRGIAALRSVANGSDRYAASRAREELQIAGLMDGDDKDG